MRSRRSLRFAVAALVAVLGCSGARGPGAPAPVPSDAAAPDGARAAGPFPSPDDLEDLAEQEAGPVLTVLRTRDVDAWELEGPFPERVDAAAAPADSPWEVLLAEAAQQRAGLVVPTEAMACVAREAGSFYLEHRAQPGPGLQRFIVTRCNASVPTYRAAVLYARLPEGVPESEILDRWRPSVLEGVRNLTAGGAATTGIWFGRRGEDAVMMLVGGTRVARLEPVATALGRDAQVVLEGEMLVPASEVSAIIGIGRFGYRHCEADAAVTLPRFRFTCRADAADRSAVVSLAYTPPGRLIAKSALNLLVSPSGTPASEYRRPAYTGSRHADSAASARAAFVELLNEVRREAGLDPLVEAEEQSEIASRLAPHFFAGLFGAAPDGASDRIALGMIAGWSVDGILQSGSFTWSVASGTDDVGRLVSEALDHPGGREVLLAPEAEKVAVGALFEPGSQAPSMAVVVGAYALFSERAHARNAEAVFVQFQKARAARGQGAAERLEEVSTLSMAAAGMVQAGADPSAALSELLAGSAQVLQRPVNGWLAQVSELDDLAFPEDFLTRASLGIAVGVSYHKAADEPWGRYVVMLVAAEPRHRSL